MSHIRLVHIFSTLCQISLYHLVKFDFTLHELDRLQAQEVVIALFRGLDEGEVSSLASMAAFLRLERYDRPDFGQFVD